MRLFLDRARFHRNFEPMDMDVLDKVLSTGYFVYLDLVFWAFLMTMLTFAPHGSIFIGFLVFIGSYCFGVILYKFLNIWLKEQPGD
jgi:hypothetical protein